MPDIINLRHGHEAARFHDLEEEPSEGIYAPDAASMPNVTLDTRGDRLRRSPQLEHASRLAEEKTWPEPGGLVASLSRREERDSKGLGETDCSSSFVVDLLHVGGGLAAGQVPSGVDRTLVAMEEDLADRTGSAVPRAMTGHEHQPASGVRIGIGSADSLGPRNLPLGRSSSQSCLAVVGLQVDAGEDVWQCEHGWGGWGGAPALRADCVREPCLRRFLGAESLLGHLLTEHYALGMGSPEVPCDEGRGGAGSGVGVGGTGSGCCVGGGRLCGQAALFGLGELRRRSVSRERCVRSELDSRSAGGCEGAWRGDPAGSTTDGTDLIGLLDVRVEDSPASSRYDAEGGRGSSSSSNLFGPKQLVSLAYVCIGVTLAYACCPPSLGPGVFLGTAAAAMLVCAGGVLYILCLRPREPWLSRVERDVDVGGEVGGVVV